MRRLCRDAPEPFMTDTLRKLRRARRLRWLWHSASVAALLVTLGAGAPVFARLSLALGTYSSIGSEYFAAFLVSPAGLVASLLIGLVVLTWIRWSRN